MYKHKKSSKNFGNRSAYKHLQRCVPVSVSAEDMGTQVDTDVSTSLVSGKSGILMEPSSGTVLYEFNPDERLQIASVTKTMTMLLIFDALESGKISYSDMVSTSEHAASMGGSQVFLEPGEQMSVDDMLKAIAISSGNDAGCGKGLSLLPEARTPLWK